MGEGFKIQNKLYIPDPDGYLYNAGNEYPALTGGIVDSPAFSTYTKVNVVKNADNIYMSAVGNDRISGITTVNKINFTNYSKMKMNLSQYKINSGNDILTMRIYDTITYTNLILNINVTTGFTTATTFEIDVSSVNGAYYPVIFVFNGGDGDGNANLTKLWLEV